MTKQLLFFLFVLIQVNVFSQTEKKDSVQLAELNYLGPSWLMNELSDWTYFFLEIPGYNRIETSTVKAKNAFHYDLTFYLDTSGRLSQREYYHYGIGDTLQTRSVETYTRISNDSVSMLYSVYDMPEDTLFTQHQIGYKVDTLSDGITISKFGHDGQLLSIIGVAKDGNRIWLNHARGYTLLEFNEGNLFKVTKDPGCEDGYCRAEIQLLIGKGIMKGTALKTMGRDHAPPHFTGPPKENFHRKESKILERYGVDKNSDAQLQVKYRYQLNRDGNLKKVSFYIIEEGKWKKLRSHNRKFRYIK